MTIISQIHQSTMMDGRDDIAVSIPTEETNGAKIKLDGDLSSAPLFTFSTTTTTTALSSTSTTSTTPTTSLQSNITTPLTLKKRRQINQLKYQSRRTPWYNSSEFDFVGQSLLHATCLFPNDKDEKTCYKCIQLNQDSRTNLEEAIQRVTLWRTRAPNGRLPPPVETSASLAETLLSDALAQDSMTHATLASSSSWLSPSSCSSQSIQSLRLSYATAIIRGVNTLADSLQKNRNMDHQNNTLSISSLCSIIGLPPWIVDVRHDAAHSPDLPSLPALRLASKSLLFFYGEKYWDRLRKQRDGIREEALRILVEYKKRSKGGASCDANQSHSHGDHINNNNNNHDDNDDDDKGVIQKCDDNNNDKNNGDKKGDKNKTKESWKYGHYSILLTEENKGSKKKKKKSTKANNHTKQSLQKNKQSSQTTAPSPSSLSNPPPQSTPQQTPLQCAKQYTTKTPPDIGYETAITYLVWGGTGDAPTGRGVLIPGSPSTYHQSNDGIQKVRDRYAPLLITLSKAWPGFVSALFVNVVHFMLAIVDHEYEHQHQHEHEVDMSITKERKWGMDAGEERKLYFLLSWVRYLLSNAFHSELHPSIAVVPVTDATAMNQNDTHTGNTTITNSNSDIPNHKKYDLKQKKANQWTVEERTFMEGLASYTVLQKVELPLNSIYQRCCTMMRRITLQNTGCDAYTNENIDATTNTCTHPLEALHQLTNLLKNILKKTDTDRVVVQKVDVSDLEDALSDDPSDRRPMKKTRVETASSVPVSVEHVSTSTSSTPEIISPVGDGNHESDTDAFLRDQDGEGMMSLEEMEYLISGGGGGAAASTRNDDGDDDGVRISLNDTIDKSNCITGGTQIHDYDKHDSKSFQNSSSVDRNSSGHESTPSKNHGSCVVPWTLCDSWEPCAIGTIPGYPS